MALRQIVAAALRANPDLKLLWHQDDTAGIDIQAFEDTLTADQRWLIATDHGDMIVKDLVKLAQRLKRIGRGNVQFVMAAHDSDWKMARGESVQWYSFARFEEARLSGLSKRDATSLATAWCHFGASTSDPSLQDLTPNLLAERLLQAAKDDGFDEGALFGALLTLRHGKDLRAHVRALLQKLDGMSLSFGGTVGEAFRLISAMHAEGLEFLSTKVLQEVMGCDQSTLQREALQPMATEAAANGGSFLRTRHRRIAKTTLNILSEDGEDAARLYLSLASSAIRLKSIKGVRLQENPANWEYSLPKHFFDTERTELAIQIAATILEVNPEDSLYAVNLARLKRESGDTRGAIQVLESATPPNDNRSFWGEWGTACGVLKDYPSNAVLHAYSLSDNSGKRPPTVEESKQALAGLAKDFEALHIEVGLPELHRARASCAWMGLLISNDRFSSSILNEHQQACAFVGNPKDVAEGVSWLCAGLAVALGDEPLAEPLAEALAKKVGKPAQFKFEGLQILLEKSQSSKVKTPRKTLA